MKSALRAITARSAHLQIFHAGPELTLPLWASQTPANAYPARTAPSAQLGLYPLRRARQALSPQTRASHVARRAPRDRSRSFPAGRNASTAVQGGTARRALLPSSDAPQAPSPIAPGSPGHTSAKLARWGPRAQLEPLPPQCVHQARSQTRQGSPSARHVMKAPTRNWTARRRALSARVVATAL